MDYLTWPMRVTGEYDLSYLDIIHQLKKNDRIFLIDLCQLNYYPFDKSISLDKSDTLYHLSKNVDDFKNIVYVTSDFNIKQTLLKYGLEDLSYVIYPWFSLLQGISFYTFDEFNILYEKFNLPKKYKLVNLNRNQKLHKFYYLNNMVDCDGFIYSNLGFYSGEKLDADVRKKVTNEKTIKEINLIDSSELVEYVYDDGLKEIIAPSEVVCDSYAGKKFKSKDIKKLTEIHIDELMKSLNSLGCIIEKEKHLEGLNHFFCVPKEYRMSYVDVILESNTIAGVRLSDKFFKSLFFEKLFLILGPKGLYKSLVSSGFKLYEGFDYTYDDKSFDIRMKSVIEQSKKICKMSLDELDKLYDKNLEKIKYNKKLIINIIDEEFHKKIGPGIRLQGNRGTAWEYINESKTRVLKLKNKKISNLIFDQSRINLLSEKICLKK